MAKRLSPEQHKVQLNVTVPIYLREAVLDTAEERGCTQSDIVRDALEKELAALLRSRSRAEAPAPS